MSTPARRLHGGPRPRGTAGRCQTHDLWYELGRQIALFLAGVTLADVVTGRVRAARRRWPAAAEPLAADWGSDAAADVAELATEQMHYLDANATEPLRPEARAAVLAALEVTGNPSSVHGRRARGAARRRECPRGAGGTVWRPASRILCSPLARPRPMRWRFMPWVGCSAGGVIVGATEHDAVRAAVPDAIVLPVDREGVAELDALAELLRDNGPALVCLMLANNETGTLQPIAQAAALCRRHGARLHVDAVQAAGRVAVDLAALGAHSLALSSHKLGGPMGAGALLLAPGGRRGSASRR